LVQYSESVSKRGSLEASLEALKRLKDDPGSEQSLGELRKALGSPHWLVVAEAANLVKARSLPGFEELLRQVWPRFSENGAKLDPGCRAKEAALTALDHLELLSPEPFLGAVRYRQLEPAAGGSVDTAGGVRQRALFALFRLCHPDALLYAGELLADADPAVRAGAIHGLTHYGDRTAAALLLHKFHSGDKDGAVVAECSAGLVTLAPDFALPALSRWLKNGDEHQRESAALALGQSHDKTAVDLLIDWLESGTIDDDFNLGVRALGLSRDTRARDYLLGLIETASAGRARSALEALATHSYDSRLGERVREAALKNQRAKLGPLVTKLFAK